MSKLMTHRYEYLIDDLREKLHDPRGSKAAVMVGAGFSRNAIAQLGTEKEFPLWSDLTERFVDRLYLDTNDASRVLRHSGAISSSLRLAEEFEQAFGRPALRAVIREQIRDDDYEPGPLHEALVDLPWTDIFTTNFDRLLERATLSRRGNTLRKRAYDIVSSVSDLPLAHHPRIVKLHGTLPELSEVTITEEDFRTYKRKYAPFVSLVRASLSENILCLFGFSGDDPNFLKWSGWIRDELKDSSPYVYMFCGRAPHQFQRKMLEGRRIIPIPICDLSGEHEFAPAFEWLLTELAKDPAADAVEWNCAPTTVATSKVCHEPWEPSFPSEANAWIELAMIWRNNRKNYRGWEPLHSNGVDGLWESTCFWMQHANAAMEGPVVDKLVVARELTWRLARALRPLPDDLVTDFIDPILEEFDSHDLGEIDPVVLRDSKESRIAVDDLRHDRIAIGLELVRHAREIGDFERFYRIAGDLEDTVSTPDDLSFIEHQRCLMLLSRMQSTTARQLLIEWDTHQASPIWTIRRAGLLMELGEVDRAVDLLIDLVNIVTLRRHRTSINYGLRSIEGLALYLLSLGQQQLDTRRFSAAENSRDDVSLKEIWRRLGELRQLGCDPRELGKKLELSAQGIRLAQREAETKDSFNVGQRSVTYPGWNLNEYTTTYRTLRFIEDTGMPISIHGVVSIKVAEKMFLPAADHVAAISTSEGIGYLLRSRDKKAAERFLDRSRLSTIAESQLELLFASSTTTLQECLDFLDVVPDRLEHKDQWSERRLEFAALILSRITPRLTDERIVESAPLVLSIAGHPTLWQRQGIRKTLHELVKRTTTLYPKENASTLFREAIKLSLGDGEGHLREDWCDPAELILCDPDTTELEPFDETVADWIRLANIGNQGIRRQACLRLASLSQQDRLTKKQTIDFRDALFAKTGSDGLPVTTGCYSSLVLRLPRKAGLNELLCFRKRYATPNADFATYWANIARTVDRFPANRPSQRTVDWGVADMQSMLELTEAWAEGVAATIAQHDTFHKDQEWMAASFTNHELHNARRAVREWLLFIEDVILLSPRLTSGLQKAAMSAISSVESRRLCTIQLEPIKCVLGESGEAEVVSSIVAGFCSKDDNQVGQSINAMIRWAKLSQIYETRIPDELSDFISTTLIGRTHRQLSQLLRLAGKLFEQHDGPLSESLRDALLFVLDAASRETDYDVRSDMSTVKRIEFRQECARTSRILSQMGVEHSAIQLWLEVAKKDRFAEVRRSI